MLRALLLPAALALAAAIGGVRRAAPPETALPPGVRVVWDAARAYRETTPTRERICLNGLWRWQPAEANAGAVPTERWGYSRCRVLARDHRLHEKGFTDAVPHAAWKDRNLGDLTAACGTGGITRTPSARMYLTSGTRSLPSLSDRQLARVPRLGRFGDLALGIRDLLEPRGAGVDRSRKPVPVDWEHLQRPG